MKLVIDKIGDTERLQQGDSQPGQHIGIDIGRFR